MKQPLVFILFWIFSIPTSLMAQTEPQDIALVNDEFQDLFYEALLQKGIENYDKATAILDKCLQIQPNNASVFSELGRNYLAQKNYKNAYASFEKATEIDPGNKWFWVGMYDVCYETKNWVQAIVIVDKLVEFKKEYKEELVSLYMNTKQFDRALALINELNDSVGKSELRDNYKFQILLDPKFQSAEMDNLIAQIKKNPKEESNYNDLIQLYNDSNQEEKALEIAKQLEAEIPTSDWAQVNLFGSHLKANDGINVVKSMNLVLASTKIDSKIKHRMLNEFLIFIKDKPQLDTDLERAVSYFDNDKEVKVAKEIGKFYHNKKKWDRAIRFYEMHLEKSPEDFETGLFLLEVYTGKGQYDGLAKKADAMIQIFPTQPQFYFYAGLAYNQLGLFKTAKETLETGMDFLVDNIDLEINFNIQLGESYNGLGQIKKKESYFSKAEKLIQQKRNGKK